MMALRFFFILVPHRNGIYEETINAILTEMW